jgi:hypothetical protein
MKKAVSVLVVLALLGGLASPARADLEIILSETGFATQYFSATTVGASGSLTATSPLTYGDFTITGLSASQLNATFSNLQSTNLSITNNTGTAHALSIITYGNNFTLPSGSPLTLVSSAGGNIFLPGTSANTNMTHQGWINNANPAIDTTPSGSPALLTPPTETSPGSQGPTFNGNSFDNGTGTTPFTRTGTNYSLTSKATINVGGSAGIHFTETLQVTPVPAPAGIVMLLTGLPCLGGACWLRRRTAPKAAV